MIYDVIIIGAGPAGMSAGIYSARSGLKTLVLESKMPGGLINYTNEVKNYPGFKNISGPDLAMAIYDHFREYDIDYKNEEVVDLKNGKIKTVVTSKNEYEGKTVIIASGRTRRSLNLPNENELRGGGVSYCALCDECRSSRRRRFEFGGSTLSCEYRQKCNDYCKRRYFEGKCRAHFSRR